VITSCTKGGCVSRGHDARLGMYRTLSGIFGCPSLNIFDALTSDLADCFTAARRKERKRLPRRGLGSTQLVTTHGVTPASQPLERPAAPRPGMAASRRDWWCAHEVSEQR